VGLVIDAARGTATRPTRCCRRVALACRRRAGLGRLDDASVIETLRGKAAVMPASPPTVARQGLDRQGSPVSSPLAARRARARPVEAGRPMRLLLVSAASVGIPFAGSPDERKQAKAIDCGFAAPGKAGLAIADAESKGAEIKAEAG